MYEFHRDKARYFNYQYLTARDYIIPFVELATPLRAGMRVLEIGCGEAGVLKAFLERGCECTGVDLAADRIELAREFLADYQDGSRVRFFSKNIYDADTAGDFGYRFDLIILKDVIEHIHDQARFMERMQDFLAPGGVVFFGFPPWQMPYGGHQQICDTRLLAALPYYHLLPARAYRFVLGLFEKKPVKIANLMEIHQTGISIERFERIVAGKGYRQLLRRYYLINPIYQYKFGIRPREQAIWIAKIPVLRNFFTTCMYYLIEKKQ